MRPILQNLKGRSVLDNFFFENDPFDEPNQMPPSKKFCLLSKLVKNAKWWSKSSLPFSHSTAKFFPLKKGFKKKSKPKSDKVATNNNKQQQTTNNKRPFFLPKINKVFLRPILQNLKGRSVLDKFFFENDPLDEPNQMPPSKKFYLLSKLVKNAKWWSKSSLPLSHSTAKFFPLKKGFKKFYLGYPLPENRNSMTIIVGVVGLLTFRV